MIKTLSFVVKPSLSVFIQTRTKLFGAWSGSDISNIKFDFPLVHH